MGIAARIITHVAAQCYRARPTGDVRRRSALSTQGDLAKGLRKHPRDVVETSPRRRANRKRRAVHAQGISGTLVDRAGVEVHGCSSHQPAGGRTQDQRPRAAFGDRVPRAIVAQGTQAQAVGNVKDGIAGKRRRGGGKGATSLGRQRVAANAHGAEGKDHVGSIQRGIAGDDGGVKGQGRRSGKIYLRGSQSRRADAQRFHGIDERGSTGRPVENQTAARIGQVTTKVRGGISKQPNRAAHEVDRLARRARARALERPDSNPTQLPGTVDRDRCRIGCGGGLGQRPGHIGDEQSIVDVDRRAGGQERGRRAEGKSASAVLGDGARIAIVAQGTQRHAGVGGVERRAARERRRSKNQHRRAGIINGGWREGGIANTQSPHGVGVRATAGRPVENQTAVPVGQVAAEISRGRIE